MVMRPADGATASPHWYLVLVGRSHCIKRGPPGSKGLQCNIFPLLLKAINLQDQKNGGLTEQQAKWIENMLSNHNAVGLPAV